MDSQQLRTCYACGETEEQVALHRAYAFWICRECLEGWFEAAYNDETCYPVTMTRQGGAPINIVNFQHVLDPAFVARFQAREREYRIPGAFRLYCCRRPDGRGCKLFLGDSRTFANNSPFPVQCPQCTLITCVCRAAYEVGETHICDTVCPLPASERGRSWQVCPNISCRAIRQHGGGCNEMLCAECRENYW